MNGLPADSCYSISFSIINGELKRIRLWFLPSLHWQRCRSCLLSWVYCFYFYYDEVDHCSCHLWCPVSSYTRWLTGQLSAYSQEVKLFWDNNNLGYPSKFFCDCISSNSFLSCLVRGCFTMSSSTGHINRFLVFTGRNNQLLFIQMQILLLFDVCGCKVILQVLWLYEIHDKVWIKVNLIAVSSPCVHW